MTFSKENENYFRFTSLVLDIGTLVLREVFKDYYFPMPLSDYLLQHKSKLDSLLRKNVLSQHQHSLLFPVAGLRDLQMLDLLSLTILIRNLHPRVSAWDRVWLNPLPTDLSVEADICRIRLIRNVIIGHAQTPSIPDSQFQDNVIELRCILLRITANLRNSSVSQHELKDKIDHILHDSIGSEIPVLLSQIQPQAAALKAIVLEQIDDLSFVTYLRSLKDGLIQIRSLPLMLIGHTGVGKSTLAHGFLGLPLENIPSTSGIDVYIRRCRVPFKDGTIDMGPWELLEQDLLAKGSKIGLLLGKVEQATHIAAAADGEIGNEGEEAKGQLQDLLKAISTETKDDKKYVNISIWDFAGQTIFYATHQTFLTKDAVYVLLHDLSISISRAIDEEWVNMRMKDAVNPVIAMLLQRMCLLTAEEQKEKMTPEKALFLLLEKKDTMFEAKDFQKRMTPEEYSTHWLQHVHCYTRKQATETDGARKESENKCFSAATKEEPEDRGLETVLNDSTSMSTASEIAYSRTAEAAASNREDAKDRQICPPVILVGTHLDMSDPVKADDYFRRIKENLALYPDLFQHVMGEPFKLNLFGDDEPITELRHAIQEAATKLETWQRVIPAKWVPFIRALQYLQESERVVAFKRVELLNQNLPVPLPENDLVAALEFHHQLKDIFCFRHGEQFILHPQWIVDAFKSIFTAEEFCLTPETPSEVIVQWIQFRKTGKISLTLIDKIWEQEKYKGFKKRRSLILSVMLQYHMIAHPDISEFTDSVDMSENAETEMFFYVPSMVMYQAPAQVGDIPPNGKVTSWLCYKSQTGYIPPAIFHNLVAACLRIWHPVAEDGEQNTHMMFCNCCVLDVGHDHQLTLYRQEGYIQMRVMSFNKNPDHQKCLSVRDEVELCKERIMTQQTMSVQLDEYFKCSKTGFKNTSGLVSLQDIEGPDIEIGTCNAHGRGTEHYKHRLCKNDLLNFWCQPLTEEASEVKTESPEERILVAVNKTGEEMRHGQKKIMEGLETIRSDTSQIRMTVIASKVHARFSEEELNCLRLKKAITTVCTPILKEVVLAHLPESDIHRLIQNGVGNKKNFLQKFLSNQTFKLFSDQTCLRQLLSQQPSDILKQISALDEDITGWFCLGRNVSELCTNANEKKWCKEGGEPDVNDRSLIASMDRIRIIRNKFMHDTALEISTADLENRLKEQKDIIKDVHNGLTIAKKNPIDKKVYKEILKNIQSDYREAKCADKYVEEYKELLTEFKGELQQTLSEKLAEIDEKLEKLGTSPANTDTGYCFII